MMPESVRRTLLKALTEYHGTGKRAAIAWVDLEPLERLSPREMDVVRLVAQGMSNKDVAGALFIDDKTVRAHLSSVAGKLNTTNRTQIAYWFWKQTHFVMMDDDDDEPEIPVDIPMPEASTP